MEHILETSVELPCSVERVFAFFGEAGNLQRITPPELNFRIVTPLPIQLDVGALIDYRLRLFGIPFRWRTRISDWSPPKLFIDEQIRGPYAMWVHTHSFEETDGRTIVRDRVRYRLPYSPVGEVAYPLVAWQLKRIFAYRTQAVREALSANGTEKPS